MKIIFSLRIEKQLQDTIRQLAAADHRSINTWIIMALEQAIKEQSK